MEVKGKRYIEYSGRAEIFKISNLSDLHYGNKACALDQIKSDIQKIKNDPNHFWLGGGDYADYIGLTDIRFDPDVVADVIKVSDLGKLGKKLTEEVRDLLYPIKHKCLGLLFGNHEKRYQRWQEQSYLHAWLCEELGVLNLGYSAMFDVVFMRRGDVKKPRLVNKFRDGCSAKSFRFFVHHGAGFATTPAGKLTRLIRFMTYFDADIYMVGHVHDQEGRRQIQIGANSTCTKLVEKKRLGLISGSYLKTYKTGVVTYGEQKGYEPTVLGMATVTIRPETREFWGRI